MPQKYLSTLLLGFVLLTACIAQTPVSTPTATLTPAPTSTATPTLTPTPTIAPLPTEGPIADLAKKLEGTGYKPAWNSDQTEFVLNYTDAESNITEVSDLQINKYGQWSRAYIFENPFGSPELMTAKGKTTDITSDLNFKGWKIENGAWVREKAISPEGIETNIQVFSIEETIQILRAVTQEYVDKNGKDVLKDDSAMREASTDRMYATLNKFGANIRDTYSIGGVNWKVHVPSVENWYWGNNEITLVNSNGTKIGNEPLLFNAFTAVGNNGEYAFMVWQDVNGNYQHVFVDFPEINEIVVGNYDTYPIKLSK